MDARETKFYITLLVIAAIIALLLGYFLWSIVRMHRRYLRLQRTRSETQLLLLEKEHTRIAADLHDELGPILSAAKFKITEVEPPLQEDQQLLHQAADHINEIIISIRKIANGLIPNTLLRKGPLEAIEEFIHNKSSSFPFKIELLIYTKPVLTEQQSIHIYRILQELVHNTHKHAKATLLKIQCFSRSGNFIILCTDNGIGFNKKKIAKENPGLGLQNLVQRTDLIGGKMILDTKPGLGTSYTFEIPLNRNSNESTISN